jgi:copper chaperone CopZ
VSALAFVGDLNRLLSVKGMTCSACSAKVGHALAEVPGVQVAQVDLKSDQAKVIADERVRPKALVVDAVQKGCSARARKASGRFASRSVLPVS